MESVLLPTGKAGSYLGISKWTLRRWVAAGRIKPQKVKRGSGYLYFAKADLDRLKTEGNHVKYSRMKKTNHVIVPKKALHQAEKEVKFFPKPIITEVLERTDAIIVPPEEEEERAPLTTSVFSKIRRFFGAKRMMMFLLVALSFASIRTMVDRMPRSDDRIEDTGIVLSAQKNLIPHFTLLDAVILAATQSGVEAPSLSFLSTDAADIERQLRSQTMTPEQGNASYTKKLIAYTSYTDSPYVYLSGERGEPGPVAIIERAESLATQPFFANVSDGDKLLIYREGNRAILLRPMTNTVVAFGPLDAVAVENPFISGLTASGMAPTVQIRRGFPVEKDMKVIEAELAGVASDLEVVSVESAMRTDYKQTVIIDASRGAKLAEARQIAKKLRISLIELPLDEPVAPAGIDFILIVGADRK
jgi:hypothetical protein